MIDFLSLKFFRQLYLTVLPAKITFKNFLLYGSQLDVVSSIRAQACILISPPSGPVKTIPLRYWPPTTEYKPRNPPGLRPSQVGELSRSLALPLSNSISSGYLSSNICSRVSLHSWLWYWSHLQ